MESIFSYFWSKCSKDGKFRVEQMKEDTMITMFQKDGNFLFCLTYEIAVVTAIEGTKEATANETPEDGPWRAFCEFGYFTTPFIFRVDVLTTQ